MWQQRREYAEQQPESGCNVGIPLSDRNDWKAPTSSNDTCETTLLPCAATALACEKPLGKMTSLSSGRSINEWTRMELPPRVIARGWQNAQLFSVVVSEVSLGKSIHHLISSYSLRMINSLDLSFLKKNAPPPNRMEVNSGKSIHQFFFQTNHSQIPHKSSYGMHHHQIEWKSIQANLFITLTSNHSLSNAT